MGHADAHQQSFLVVDIEDSLGFWCNDNFDQTTGWFDIPDVITTMIQNKSITYAAWQEFQMRRCFCSGRGD